MSYTPTIKIAVLLPSAQTGGAERLVFEEISYLSKSGQYQFELHLVFEKGDLFHRFQELGIPIRVWNAPHRSIFTLFAYVRIAYHFKTSNIKIIHSHLLNKYAGLIGKLSKIPVVTTVHADVTFGKFEELALSLNNLVFGCGSRVVERISGFLPPHKVMLLKNAINVPNVEAFSPKTDSVLSNYGVSPDSLVFLTLGRLTRQKGYDLLIAAFKRVHIKLPSAVLLIGGVGEEEDKLSSQINELALDGKVKLIGLVDDPHQLLPACTVYVNSSRWEGLPMTLLEAMAHKRAIVATDVGGNSEVVKDGITGLLVPPEKLDDLASAMIRVGSDSVLSRRIGESAFALFNEQFSIQNHCETLCHCYSKM